jgi:hypothetical protein
VFTSARHIRVKSSPHPRILFLYDPYIFLPSTPRVLSSVLPFYFPAKSLYAPLFYLINATCPTRLIILYLMNLIIFGEEYKLHELLFLIALCFINRNSVLLYISCVCNMNLRGLRLSQRCLSRLLSSGMWRGIILQIFAYVSAKRSATIAEVEDGGSTFLRNVSKGLPNYTASHPRRQ